MNATPPHPEPSEPTEQLCPFCGKVIEHTAVRCRRCRMLLDEPTRQSLQRLMGPWFVLDENIASAPGVTWQKFRTLIAKGKIQPDSIIRGPATAGLWRRAQDAPSVATAMGLCWKCHAPQPPDRAASRCIACSARLNGPTAWSEVAAATTPAPVEDSSAIDDLIQARPVARADNGFDRAAARRSSPAGMLLTLLVVAALAGGGGFAIHKFLTNQGGGPVDEPGSTDARPRRPGTRTQADNIEKVFPSDGSPPGDLFPATSYERRGETSGTVAGTQPGQPSDPLVRQRREAQVAFERAKQAEAAGDLMAAQGLLIQMIKSTDREALPDGALQTLKDVQARIIASMPRELSPEELAGQQTAAAETLVAARGLIQRTQLMEAQKLLVEMLNTADRRAWPRGAVETLADVQGQIRKAAADAGVPKPTELLRQRESASKLFAQAQTLMGEGNYVAAQEPLLKILNQHHPKAWPEGAEEAYHQIQDAFRKNPPTTRPKFFEIEPE